jgi:hypothetical protein
LFCYLGAVGIVFAFFKLPALVIAAVIFGLYGIGRFERRYPRTAGYLAAFISGLCGGRGYWRRW